MRKVRYDNKKEGWQSLEADPTSLVETRLQLHYAALLVSSIGSCILPQEEDYSNTALLYDANHWGFKGMQLATGFSSMLLFAGGELALNDVYDRIIARKPFSGHDTASLLEWLRVVLLKEGVVAKNLKVATYPDFPDHPIARNSPFPSLKEQEVQEFGRYYHNSFSVLERIEKAHKGASPILVWPHHFDMATLITVRPPSAPGKEDGSSVGVGFSPGDEHSPEPYWYATPWPYPEVSQLPPLPTGKWNKEGWVGARLSASELLSTRSTEEALSDFLNSATQASIGLLS